MTATSGTRRQATAFAPLAASRAPTITTTYVLLECGNTVARTPLRPFVIRLRNELLDRNCLIEPTISDCEQAWAAYARGEAGNAGIVDHVSFAVMRRLGLTDAFTNDRHFLAAGFVPLF